MIKHQNPDVLSSSYATDQAFFKVCFGKGAVTNVCWPAHASATTSAPFTITYLIRSHQALKGPFVSLFFVLLTVRNLFERKLRTLGCLKISFLSLTVISLGIYI
jgi:hypothetical protein